MYAFLSNVKTNKKNLAKHYMYSFIINENNYLVLGNCNKTNVNCNLLINNNHKNTQSIFYNRFFGKYFKQKYILFLVYI